MKKILFAFLAAQLLLIAGCASTPTRTTTVYSDRPVYAARPVPVYVQPAPQPVAVSSQDDYNKKVIKQGLLGAATGAISAEASGGKAGQGALIGAGTNVIGGALFDMLTAPQPPSPQYAPYVTQWNQENPNTHRIVRQYDSNGNVTSEEVFTR